MQWKEICFKKNQLNLFKLPFTTKGQRRDGMGWDGMGWDGMGWDRMGGEGSLIGLVLFLLAHSLSKQKNQKKKKKYLFYLDIIIIFFCLQSFLQLQFICSTTKVKKNFFYLPSFFILLLDAQPLAHKTQPLRNGLRNELTNVSNDYLRGKGGRKDRLRDDG
jgi:hypothetical protein